MTLLHEVGPRRKHHLRLRRYPMSLPWDQIHFRYVCLQSFLVPCSYCFNSWCIDLPPRTLPTFGRTVLLLRSVWSPASAETPFSISFEVRLESSVRPLLSESPEMISSALLAVSPELSAVLSSSDSELSGSAPGQHLRQAHSTF